jgi:hypothetical protein
MKILDLSQMTRKEAIDMLDKGGLLNGHYENVMKTHSRYRDEFWSVLQMKFSSKAKFNAFLRKTLGYDAVFDDTNSVFSGEVQLIVFDPKHIKTIERIDQKGIDGHKLKDIVSQFDSMMKKFGKTKTSGIRKYRNDLKMNIDLTLKNGTELPFVFKTQSSVVNKDLNDAIVITFYPPDYDESTKKIFQMINMSMSKTYMFEPLKNEKSLTNTIKEIEEQIKKYLLQDK